MGIRKGTKLTRLPEEVLTKRIFMRCLELQENGVTPTLENIGPMGCTQARVLRIRDDLIRDGLVSLPDHHLYKRVHDRVKWLAIYQDSDEIDPGPEEQREIQARIEEMREIKQQECETVNIRVCKAR